MSRYPPAYVAAVVAVLGVGLFILLAALGVIPIEQLFLFFVGNVLLFVLLLVFAALGGAFVGLLLAQRIFGGREFSPLERSLVEALAEVKRLREAQEKNLARLDRQEPPLEPRR